MICWVGGRGEIRPLCWGDDEGNCIVRVTAGYDCRKRSGGGRVSIRRSFAVYGSYTKACAIYIEYAEKSAPDVAKLIQQLYNVQFNGNQVARMSSISDEIKAHFYFNA